MKNLLLIFIFLCAVSSLLAQTPNYNQLSEELITHLKDNQPVESILETIAEINPKELEKQLDNDEKRKAFWINLYNGLVISKLSMNPALFEDRGKFFKNKQFMIAGKKISLDKIEHGIIRRSRKKLSLGYLKKWFPSKFEKRFWVDEIDGRIHYALNCGAKSCPPARVYHADKMNEQLDQSAKNYLENKVEFKETEKEIYVPVLFSWFIGDFGGKKGVYDFLVKYDILKESQKDTYDIEYLDYDWTLDIDNFVE
jgi:hypothetical protein